MPIKLIEAEVIVAIINDNSNLKIKLDIACNRNSFKQTFIVKEIKYKTNPIFSHLGVMNIGGNSVTGIPIDMNIIP